MSPNPSRFGKEFVKNSETLYMPIYTSEELLTIGSFLHTRLQSIDSFAAEEYTSDKIRARFDVYGGILRHVIPVSPTHLVSSQNQLKVAQHDIDFRKIHARVSAGVTESDPVKVSHFSLQIVPYYNFIFENLSPHTFDQAVAERNFMCHAFMAQFASFQYLFASQSASQLFQDQLLITNWDQMLEMLDAALEYGAEYQLL